MEKKRPKDALLTDENRLESAKLKELYTAANHGLSQAAFGAQYEIGNQGAVWQCLNASGMPISLKAAQGFAKGLGCNIADFSPRLAALAKGISTSFVGNVPANTQQPREINLENNPEYPAIKRVKFKLSAGASGFSVDYIEEEAAPIVFLKSWYESRSLTPAKLFAVKVANGSMQPGLHDGDTVVVNTGSTDPRDGVVFAVNYEGEMVVKRLVRDEGSWWLSSDNPDQRRYPRKRMHEGCFILGEIVHKQSERI